LQLSVMRVVGEASSLVHTQGQSGAVPGPATNFLGGAWLETDKYLFFGPLTEDDRFEILQPGWKLAHVMHAAGLFSSVGEARRNGWDRPIDAGFSSFVVGKRRRTVAILNVVD
jgi:hypothetical protein